MLKKVFSFIVFIAIVVVLWYTFIRPLSISQECIDLCEQREMIASYETDVCYCKSR